MSTNQFHVLHNCTVFRPAQVPFDETIVKYYWISDRVFEIVDIELRSKNKTVLTEQALLTTEQGSVSEVVKKLAQEGAENEEEESEVFEEEF